MKKLENLIKNYKGIIIFYVIIAVLSLMLTKKIDNINQIESKIQEQESFYA